jgi:hypothetical protein
MPAVGGFITDRLTNADELQTVALVFPLIMCGVRHYDGEEQRN